MTKVDLDALTSKSVCDDTLETSELVESDEHSCEPDLEEEKEVQLLSEPQIDPKHLEEIKGLLFEISTKSELIKQTYQWV